MRVLLEKNEGKQSVVRNSEMFVTSGVLFYRDSTVSHWFKLVILYSFSFVLTYVESILLTHNREYWNAVSSVCLSSVVCLL